jgi:hypothetical protein
MERTPNATQDEGNFAGPNCGLFCWGAMEYRFLMRGLLLVRGSSK